jgi:phage major head subunit gpT-like protein
VAQITLPLLLSINDSVNMSFNTQLFAAPSLYKKFCFEAKSTGANELYPRLDMLPGLRQWVGDRVVHNLSAKFFSIENEHFEETISVQTSQVEDDNYGFLSGVAAQIGQDAGEMPDLLSSKLFAAGTSSVTYDGQYFFDTAHPNYTSAGAPDVAANYQLGKGYPSWYLIDATRVQKPFIFQTRTPFRVTPKFSLTDTPNFFDKEIIWGVDGRCNAGYGLWQLAYRSDAELTLANLIAARTAMASLRRPNGAPMGIGYRPLMLVVPTSLAPVAEGYATNEFDPNPATSGSFFPNTMRGKVIALENPWLN